jgi:hypothetical protein
MYRASISTNIFAFNFAKKTLLRRDKVLHIDFFEELIFLKKLP